MLLCYNRVLKTKYIIYRDTYLSTAHKSQIQTELSLLTILQQFEKNHIQKYT